MLSKYLEGGTHTPLPSLHPKVTFRTRRQFSFFSGTHHIPARRKAMQRRGLGRQAGSYDYADGHDDDYDVLTISCP